MNISASSIIIVVFTTPMANFELKPVVTVAIIDATEISCMLFIYTKDPIFIQIM